MPSSKTQKYLGYIGTMGVLTACFGCGLAANNQMRAAQIFLLVAWLILVPLFGYLLSARRHMKRVARTRTAHRQEELDALASVLKGGRVPSVGERVLAEARDEGEMSTIETTIEGDK